MSQEHSVNECVVTCECADQTTSGEESTLEKLYSSPPSDNCEEYRANNNYSGSLRSNKKIFVGALTPETTEQNLIDYFSKFGEIVSCAVKVYRDTGYSRGFGFIVFKSDEDVKKVLSISEHVLNGKKIDPKPAKCPKDTQRKVFVGGLDPDVSPKEIEEHFSKFGKVEAVETPFDNTRMRRRSYVFVVFSSECEAKRAASIERQDINGKSCDVRVAVPREVSIRQRAMAQATPQFTLADIQQAMLNLIYYNSISQQPALQSHFAWPQAAHLITNRSPFRATYDQQASEKLFNQSAISRTDGQWYDSSVSRPPPPPPQQASVSAAPSPRNPTLATSTHPYLTFPLSYHSAAAVTPQHFYFQATPGYYYQPAPASVSSSDIQNSTPGANGNVNQVTNQAAINDLMAAIATANQIPFLAAPTASAYPTVPPSDIGYMYRQQQQAQQQQTINPAFYQGTPVEGMFNDAANFSRSHFYGGTVAPTSSNGNVPTSTSPLKPRGSKSQLNGVHQTRGTQNGHGMKDGEGMSAGCSEYSVAVPTNGTSATVPSLETQMTNLSVEQI